MPLRHLLPLLASLGPSRHMPLIECHQAAVRRVSFCMIEMFVNIAERGSYQRSSTRKQVQRF